MTKSMLACAVALALLGTAQAAQTEWVDYDHSTPVYNYPGTDGSHLPIYGTDKLKQDESGNWVFEQKAVLDTSNSKGNGVLAATADSQVVINKGSIWVVGDGNGLAMDIHYGRAGTIINEGFIYVDGTDPNQVKGMNVNPAGTAINKGYIIVKNGAGLEDGSGSGKKTLKNEGVISVVGEGIGINYRKEGGVDVSVSNTGQILVSGAGIGVHIGDPDGGVDNYQGKSFTNTGLINATGRGV